MAPECTRLLKATCALLGVSVSEFCYDAVSERFIKLCIEDERFLRLLEIEELPVGSRAYTVREQLLNKS